MFGFGEKKTISVSTIATVAVAGVTAAGVGAVLLKQRGELAALRSDLARLRAAGEATFEVASEALVLSEISERAIAKAKAKAKATPEAKAKKKVKANKKARAKVKAKAEVKRLVAEMEAAA